MTMETLQSLAAAGSDYWRWRLLVALANQGAITILPVPYAPGDVGRRGYGWRPGNVVG